jgi:hypothetical protein
MYEPPPLADAADITMVNALSTVPFTLTARSVNVYVPATVGVPDKMPTLPLPADNASPVGNEPDSKLYVTAAIPGMSHSSWYGTLTFPLPNIQLPHTGGSVITAPNAKVG